MCVGPIVDQGGAGHMRWQLGTYFSFVNRRIFSQFYNFTVGLCHMGLQKCILIFCHFEGSCRFDVKSVLEGLILLLFLILVQNWLILYLMCFEVLTLPDFDMSVQLVFHH